MARKKKSHNPKFNKDEVNDILSYINELYPQKEECYIKIFSKYTKEFKFYKN